MFKWTFFLISSDLFNLPLPALWTVVLGEYNRTEESGYEQRIPVDKIVMHEKYHHFKHDLGREIFLYKFVRKVVFN